MTRFRYLADVVTLALDDAKCTGCGLCTHVCPRGVLAIENDEAVIVDRDACMECGACASNCATHALTVRHGVGCAAAVLNGMMPGWWRRRGRNKAPVNSGCECTPTCG